jgi:glycosyltransferase involved in cell wall biosynthesis
MDRDRFELHLALLSREGVFLEALPDDVIVHDLGGVRTRWAWGRVLSLVKRLEPNVVFASHRRVSALLVLLRPLFPKGTRLVVEEPSVLSLDAVSFWREKIFHPLLLRGADRVVCQTEAMVREFADTFRVPERKLTRIYNPLDIDAVRALAEKGANPFESHGPGPHLVAAGRLDPVKGFDILIESFPRLLTLRPEAKLWIAGAFDPEGAHERKLLALRNALGLSTSVHFLGFVENPFLLFRHADLFVLSSRYEGLPNVLLEALACGCPVLALDRPGGTREALELMGLEHRLVASLDWQEEWLVASLREGPRPELETFRVDRIVKQFERVLSPIGD